MITAGVPAASTVTITSAARAILALDDELLKVLAEIAAEKRRHADHLAVLEKKQQALESAIQVLGAQ